jgi:hypothetical protein
MRVLPWIWGGKHSLIIPTNGSTISDRFWQLLETFDPDYVCSFEWTLKDWKERLPERYEECFRRWLRQQKASLAEGETLPSDPRASFDDSAHLRHLRSVDVDSMLQRELRARVAPFYFEEHVVKALSESQSDSSYPHTSIHTILPQCEHPDRIYVPDVTAESMPPLWIESIFGATSAYSSEQLRKAGVAIERFEINDVNGSERMHEFLARGGDPDVPLYDNPFQLSMLGLAPYRATGRPDDGSAVVVYGSSLRDFALYFSLKAVRDRVYWLIPEWVNRFEQARHRASHGGESARREEQYVRSLAQRLVNETLQKRMRSIQIVSESVGQVELDRLAQEFPAWAFTAGDRVRGTTQVCTDITKLTASPLRVLNTDAFGFEVRQVVGEDTPGLFPTPKPKGFKKIVPYYHRWITELRVEGMAYPRHPEMGTYLIRDAVLSSDDVRAGADGICYACPSTAYFGGDVDTILRRPQVRLPSAERTIDHIATSAGFDSKLSDKGFYAHEFIRKLGGLQQAASFIRNAAKMSVVIEYRKGRDMSPRGCFLSGDKRRYLDLEAITNLASEIQPNVLIDELVQAGLLHRGVVLKCRFCRGTDFFFIADVSDSFRCNRCRFEQQILSANSLNRPEPTWYYRLDELVFQGFANNMQVPIIALDCLRRRSKAFMYTDEREFRRAGEETPAIEVDLCYIADGFLTIGEAKIGNQLEDGANAERNAIKKYRELGEALGANQFVFATSVAWSERTVRAVEDIFQGSLIKTVPLIAADLYP